MSFSPNDEDAQIELLKEIIAKEEERGQFNTVHHATLQQILERRGQAKSPKKAQPSSADDSNKEK